MNQKDRTEMEKKTFHAAETFNGRTEQLKEYLRRLGAGEALESVRADFVKQFSDVEASEIMQAEQKLLKEGTPLTEVQKLCDVHSALFHGATKKNGSPMRRKRSRHPGRELQMQKTELMRL